MVGIVLGNDMSCYVKSSEHSKLRFFHEFLSDYFPDTVKGCQG